ncbi:hypothetical protein MBANPS3_006438, partial [Mucor bainieri]
MDIPNLTDHLWDHMENVQFVTDLLKRFQLETEDAALTKVKNAMKNIKRRKRYNARLMDSLLNKMNKELSWRVRRDGDIEDNVEVDVPQAAGLHAFVEAAFSTQDEDNSYSSEVDTDEDKVPKVPLVQYYLVCTEGDYYSFKLKADSSMWILENKFNVSEAFVEFRDRCIKKAEDFQELNMVEELALNGVMLIEDSVSEQGYIQGISNVK